MLVCIDPSSRYLEVKIVLLTKSASVMPHLDKIFSVHGLPIQVISENGALFNSTEFAKYMDTFGIQFQGSYRIFNIIFPEFLMISTYFPLSFPIKIDMFSPESVVCKSHEV